MAITYGPSGTSFVVRHGGRVVQRARTEEGARAAATRLSAQFGGEVKRDDVREAPKAPTEPKVVMADAVHHPPADFGTVLDLSIAKLRERLAVGDLDDHLVALDAAERSMTTRKPRAGALDAIADRRRATSNEIAP
jgi:hypothetical protein